MTETKTPPTPEEMADRARQTREAKKSAAEASAFPPRAWVRVVDGTRHYAGRIGKVTGHNDIQSKQHPTIEVEIGVAFGKGQSTNPTWFRAAELERCKPPAEHW